MSDIEANIPDLAIEEPDNLNHYFNLEENPDNHYTFLPIHNRKYYNFYKEQLATFWTLEELDLSKDKDDFEKKLNKDEQFSLNILWHILQPVMEL